VLTECNTRVSLGCTNIQHLPTHLDGAVDDFFGSRPTNSVGDVEIYGGHVRGCRVVHNMEWHHQDNRMLQATPV